MSRTAEEGKLCLPLRLLRFVPIYARCCAEVVVNGTAEHGWARKTADLENRPRDACYRLEVGHEVRVNALDGQILPWPLSLS